jgi:D-glycero-D-manno-heptose 1,7-bisphosphate phosphatase
MASIRQCAVLAGGLGSRLGAITTQIPKPLLPIGDRPFLAWLLRELVRFGVEEVLLLTGHLSDRVEAAVHDLAAMLPRRIAITISQEPMRAGTGGALFHARARLHDRFLLCNGDSILDANLANLLAAACLDAPCTVGRIMLRRLSDASRYGIVECDGDRITAFRERPAVAGDCVINGGLYLFDRRVLQEVTEVCSLERDVMPRLAVRGALRGTVTDGWFIDIGIPADLARARAELPARLHRPALFLDRDITINVDHGWVGTRGRFECLPGAREAVRLATASGWHVFIVSNQSGVACGDHDEAAVVGLHGWLVEEMRRAGGTVDDVRYCPIQEEATAARHRGASDLPKPAPGMIGGLISCWDLDTARCVMVGGQPSDMAAAAAAGIAGHLFGGGDLAQFVAPLLRGEASR